MKRGFRLVLHKDVPAEDREFCLQYLKDTMSYFDTEESYKVGYTNKHAFYRRGILGKPLDLMGAPDSVKGKYFFRRLVKNRRIFGVVPLTILEGKDEPIDIKQCFCAIHGGGQRVRLKNGYNDNDYEVVYEVGDIKG